MQNIKIFNSNQGKSFIKSKNSLFNCVKKQSRIFAVLFLITILHQTSTAQLLLDEEFTSYSNASLSGQGSWTTLNSSNLVMNVSNSSPISISGCTGAGGQYVTGGTSGGTPYTQRLSYPTTNFAASSDQVFFLSFLLNVSATGSDAEAHLVGLGNDFGGTNYEFTRVHVRSSGAGFNVGISEGNGTGLGGNATAGIEWGSTVYNLNTTYHIVTRYSYDNGGGANADALYLWVNPSITSGSEPSTSSTEASIAAGARGNDILFDGDNVRNLYLSNRDGSGVSPVFKIDAIKYARGTNSSTSWSNLGITGNCSNGTISTTGTLSAFTSCFGVPSSDQNFAVSGAGLSANLVVTAPTGFEVSLSSGSGYNSSVSLTPSSGTVSSTTIYVRLTSSASGSPSGNVVCSSTGATSQSVSASGTVSTVSLSASSQTNVACFGGNTGAASVNAASGGTPTYAYNWTPGNPTGDGTVSVTGLTAGTWTCTVTDANSCTAAQTFTVTQPTALSVTPSSQTNVACFGGASGAASINTPTGGAGGYAYNWTPGNPTGDGTVSVTGLTAGSWTCTVTDANSCTAAQTFTVTQPTALSVTPSSQTNISCFGGANGAASINTPTGGAGGYAYNWTPGNPTGDGTVSVTGLSAGTWTCTVTDANSCTAAQTFTVTQPTALSVTPSSQTNVACFGGASGAASINTPTGGAGGYAYNWTPGNPTGDGTVSVTGLTAGSWTCTVTDANSCTAAQTFTVTQPSAIIVSAASQTNIACNGGANGAASINTPSGGAGGYVYDWTPGNPTGDGTVSVTGLTATTYTVTVTDANSCEATQTFNITEPAQLSVASSSQVNECIGGSNGTATVSMTGGTTNYTYSWSPSGGSASTGTGLSAGNYTVTVTDANGCSTTQTFTILTTTEYTYTGNSPDDWLDEGNWSPCYPGTTIASGSTVIVSPGSNLVIPTGTTIINEGTLLNNGTLTISGGTFTNNGDYTGSGAYTGGVFVNPTGGTVNPGQ